ncbi:MAG: hypothetical protein KDC46_09595 [Thermoleophilia bacterium]|nr:hypothetical protein [Thermoleophilia bacterium]
MGMGIDTTAGGYAPQLQPSVVQQVPQPVQPAPLIGGGPTADAQLAAQIQQLATAVADLAQAIAAIAPVIVPSTNPYAATTTAGGPGVPGPSSPIQTSPVQGIPVQGTPTQQLTGTDGPGVIRKIMPKDQLEKNPKLRGKLDPPTGGKPPKGVKVHTRADGTRVLTVNLHGGAPAGKSPTQGQDIRALRDVARYVNAVNPDVVMVQELDDVPNGNIPHESSVFAHLIGATDMAFTPGNGATHGLAKDSGMYTRNGYTIDHAVNVDLPDTAGLGERSAGVAAVVPPDGGAAFTVVATHLSHKPGVTASKSRKEQMQEIARVVKSIEEHGSFTYSVPGMSKQLTATGFPTDRIMLGGDLNTTQGGRNGGIDSADRLLGAAGLRHANDLYGTGNVHPGIDHIYAYGFGATSSAKFEFAANELPSGRPTDHPGYVTDLR